jgi:subtilisin-like proprotein convertase family protein
MAIVPIEITGGLTIGDLNVELNITHSYIEEVNVKLQGPASIGSPIITLFNGVCEGNDNINCIVDDSGSPLSCGTNPSISGNVQPQETLTGLNGLIADGTWNLIVTDNETGDGGSINAVKIIICNISPPLSIEENVLSGLKIYPNPTTGIVNIDLGNANLDNKSIVKLYDIQGRIISTKEMNSSVDNINISNLSDGVYLITIENGSSKTTKKIVLNR